MIEKYTIINILNKLAAEHKLYWQIKSAYQDGLDQNMLEILIYTLPRQARRGHILYDGNTGLVKRAQYTGLREQPADGVVDMLLDVLNFEKHRSNGTRGNKAAVPAS